MSNPVFNAGLINYLKAKHFRGTLSKDIVFSLLNRLDSESPDSLTSSALALGLLGSPDPGLTEELRITTPNGPLDLQGRLIKSAEVPAGSAPLRFAGSPGQYFFYSLVEGGFDRSPQRQGERTSGVAVARDIVDAKGMPVTRLQLGEKYRVILRVQADKSVDHFALQDLLPGGFQPDLEALQDRRSVGGEGDAWHCEQVDVRDDRLILFGSISQVPQVFSYEFQPTVRGTFVWPGLYGEAMYDPRTYAWEKASSVTVE